ncbi:MAG: excinuclease ABC subunit UvrC [Deltaproteobacteria bacterium]|nr:excinuclease ABC subunit UvrC [Deltaproteobacteria bacterium]
MFEHLEPILDSLPDSPGVYLHKDEEGRILYVGKAKSLRSRVRSYFQPSAEHPPRISAMVRQVRDIDLFQTRSEAEALILEANLIKKHRPRYNVNLKDDKSYPFFKLTTGERYPRLFLTREKFDKNAEYFGPYASVRDARETLSLIRRHFRLRTSKMQLDGTRVYRPCINFQLGKCLAPCRGIVPQEDYAQVVAAVRMFFQGRDRELQTRMEAEMTALATDQRYEDAARIRDAMRAVQRTLEKQRVLVPDLDADQDVLALARESHFAGVEVLFIRHGRLIGSDFLPLDRTEGMSDSEILRSVMARLYTRPAALFPREILLPEPVEDMDVLEDFLTTERGGRVRILTVQRGDKRRLIELAEENARRHLKERLVNTVDDDTVLAEVQRTLHLRRPPRRVEAFDISNIQGTDTVASMVVFQENRPHTDDYRKFRIRSVTSPDDFTAMLEVLTRHYRRVSAGEGALPDLILIDGGKGQVNIAEQVLTALGISLSQVDLIGLAKGRTEKRAGRGRGNLEDYEYVVKPNMKNELRLRRNSTTLHFLQRIRDESHRFAITYHRTLRRKHTLRTGLMELEGVGPSRARTLLRHFGSLRRVKAASLEELLRVPGLPRAAAERIHATYRGETPSTGPESEAPTGSEPAGE